MPRGDVVRAHLPQPQGQPGREQFGTRPAVVVQAEGGQYANLKTIVVVPLTSNLKALSIAGSLRIEPTAMNGLTMLSVALTQQIRAIDANRISETIGKLSDSDLALLDDAMKSLLGL